VTTRPSRRLRLAALVLVAALPLAACGAEAEEPAGAATESADAAFPRTVEHAMGSTEIPERPDRVVVLDTGELDSVTALGVTPVGAVTTDVATGFLSYLEDAAAGVEQVGTIGEPNLEAIAALAPDLILSNKVRHEDLYEQLSQIAPTVFAESVGAAWKDNVALAAESLGLEAEAAEALAAYRQEAAELGEQVGEVGTVSTLRFVGGTIRAYRSPSFIGTVLADVGLEQVELPEGEVATFAELSAEELTLADGDVVLYSSYGDAAESGEQEVVAGPLWSRLTAVQDGRAFAVEDDVFYTGIGLTSANLILDRLRDMLAG
jgi:iron complex transport system substrate-binding protein